MKISRRSAPRLRRRQLAGLLLAPWLAGGGPGCRRPSPPDGTGSGRSATRTDPEGAADIRVDLDTVTGPFARLSGVQGSPHPIVADDVDHRERFRAHHIERVRFPQDCPPNTLTLAGIFPDEQADPRQPPSYRFGAIDQHVAAARDAGASILWQSSYDVGGSDRWVGMNLGGRAPANLERWCTVVRRCLEHFNNRWAGGFEAAVRSVEFVNEPDGLGGFRGPKLPEIIPAFSAFLGTVAAYNREHPETPVRAVGPGIPFSFAEWTTWQPRLTKLLAALGAARLELPVLSFHTYGRDTSPGANERLARALRALLDQHGLRRTELWNTEWQGGDFLRGHLGIPRHLTSPPTEQQLRTWGTALASYALACKIRWQGVVTGSYYYRANMRAFGPERPLPKLAEGTIGQALLFAPTGAVRPLALQELITYEAARAVPLRCRTEWNDDGLLAALGLRAEDGKRAGLLVSSLSPTPRAVVVRLAGQRWSARGRARLVGLDAARGRLEQLEPLDVAARGGALELSLELPALDSRMVLLDLA